MGAVSIFNSNYGKAGVVTLSSGIQPCFNFRIGSQKNPSGTTIVTNFTIRKAENIAVTPTLGSQLFLYVGGKSAWEIAIEGLALATCNSSTHGFDDIIGWYANQNVQKTGKPLKLVLGGQVFKGYLYKLDVQSEYKLCNAFTFAATFVGVRV